MTSDNNSTDHPPENDHTEADEVLTQREEEVFAPHNNKVGLWMVTAGAAIPVAYLLYSAFLLRIYFGWSFLTDVPWILVLFANLLILWLVWWGGQERGAALAIGYAGVHVSFWLGFGLLVLVVRLMRGILMEEFSMGELGTGLDVAHVGNLVLVFGGVILRNSNPPEQRASLLWGFSVGLLLALMPFLPLVIGIFFFYHVN